MTTLQRAAGLVIGAVVLLAGCGNSPEVDKSIEDIRGSVELLREAIDDEREAVKTKAPDAAEQVRTVQALAEREARNLETYASRAPVETQDFADAARGWAAAVAVARAAADENVDSGLGAAAFATVAEAEERMDQAAEDLDVEPWSPREQ